VSAIPGVRGESVCSRAPSREVGGARQRGMEDDVSAERVWKEDQVVPTKGCLRSGPNSSRGELGVELICDARAENGIEGEPGKICSKASPKIR